ncbi:MAG: isoprenylcysteine carboxylmethyltransferase family protein [Planctomycetota bacterium]|nr:isoprenylcysteine carboxylmethyltransferase family protein [Planctomycetota bacterium]
MSRSTTAILPLAVPAGVGGIIFASAGRWYLPFVWVIIGVLASFYLALAAFADPGMMRERLAPGPGSQDRLTRFLGGGMLVGHWVLVGLDVGRLQWSLVPWEVQVAGLVGYVASLCVLFWAMHANPFYSSVVRVQTERGHHAVVAGPYRYVRHPGYAATLFAMLSGGVALGSWLAMLPILVFVGLFIRRTLLEDRLLQQELEGYAEYAQKVRYRLVVGLF